MNGRYLIPANSKKSMMIFGLFYPFDLILFSIGIGLSIILVISLPMATLKMSLIAISPGCITGFLVFPLPNYHNVLTFLKCMFIFFTLNQKFKWKGWCYLDGKEEKK